MLYDINGKRETSKPHYREYLLWKERLQPEEYEAIENKINSMIEKDEIHTSSWMPGNNWAGTVYEPIYTKCCNNDERLSGLCFGLFVWYIFQDREDEWYFGKFEKDGFPIKGMTYFRKQN